MDLHIVFSDILQEAGKFILSSYSSYMNYPKQISYTDVDIPVCILS